MNLAQSIEAGSRAGACVASSIAFADGGEAADAACRRFRVGTIDLDVRQFPVSGVAQLTARPSVAIVVVALEGSADVIGESFRSAVDAGQGVLLARPGASTLAWSPGSRGAIIHLPRVGVQARASRCLDQPVRLAAGDVALRLPPRESLVTLLSDLIEEAERTGSLLDHRQRLWSERLEAAITGLLADHPDRGTILPIARSIHRAMQRVRENAEADLDAEKLAAMSGITARTLREGFRACLGVPLAAFVQETRLNKVREKLASCHETRPIAEVARAAGFRSVSSFTRAYARAFEESPTETRARSVRQAQLVRERD